MQYSNIFHWRLSASETGSVGDNCQKSEIQTYFYNIVPLCDVWLFKQYLYLIIQYIFATNTRGLRTIDENLVLAFPYIFS